VKEVANKSFRVTLSNQLGLRLGTTKDTTVTIMDNDQAFSFEVASYYLAEDAGMALISVLRGTDDTNSNITVDYATANGSALSGTGLHQRHQTPRVCTGRASRWFPSRSSMTGQGRPRIL